MRLQGLHRGIGNWELGIWNLEFGSLVVLLASNAVRVYKVGKVILSAGDSLLNSYMNMNCLELIIILHFSDGIRVR